MAAGVTEDDEGMRKKEKYKEFNEKDVTADPTYKKYYQNGLNISFG